MLLLRRFFRTCSEQAWLFHEWYIITLLHFDLSYDAHFNIDLTTHRHRPLRLKVFINFCTFLSRILLLFYLFEMFWFLATFSHWKNMEWFRLYRFYRDIIDCVCWSGGILLFGYLRFESTCDGWGSSLPFFVLWFGALWFSFAEKVKSAELGVDGVSYQIKNYNSIEGPRCPDNFDY